MSGLGALISRDVRLAWRAGGGAAQGVAFFALVILIFAFAVGADRALLGRLAAPILWAAALLAALASIDRLFQSDAEDGALDVMIETTPLLSAAVAAKALSHWLTTGLPLLAATPLLGLLLNMPAAGYAPTLITLGLGTPGLSLIAALVGALTLSLRRSALLSAMLAAPLFTPILIFGVGAAQAGIDGAAHWPSDLLLLGAATLSALAVAPLAGAAALRFNLS